ncbi:MAG: hypothetical protein ABEI52_05305, partial [Halobacteriaceae archaeon]
DGSSFVLMDGKVGSFSADDAFNSEIGDSVDYLDPRWLARTDAFVFVEQVIDVPNWDGTVTGSATISDAIFGTTLSTGTTSGSVAQLFNGVVPARGVPSWDKDRVFRTAVEIKNSDADRIDYYTTGRPANGDEGFGFKLVEVSGTPTLQGIVHNGSSETATDLIANPGTGERDLRAELDAGSSVTFYVDGNKKGTISSGLPTGTNQAVVPVVWYVENTAAVDRGLQVSEVWTVGAP